jgi:mutator family transposase
LGRNDTYGYALAAQPDQSQGRPTTNAGSQPSEQERPAHTCSPKAPVPDGRTVCPGHHDRRAERHEPPPGFIPGTNAIESLNYQLRKIIKNRGHFPSDDAVIKLLWLAIRDIEDKRARARAKEAGLPANARRAPARLVEGSVVPGWKQALGALALAYPDRIAPYLN